MNFKKLALAAAVAVAPMSALALEPMQDEALSAVTGQDGLTVNLDIPSLALDMIVHDKDGNGGAAGTDDGAIVIEGVNLATGAGGIDLVIDADGDNGGTAPYLNVGVSIASGTTLSTGDISVATSSGVGGGLAGLTNQTATILDSMDITLGQIDLNIQLGNDTAQGAMIVLDTSVTYDAGNEYAIGIQNFSLNDTTGYAAGSGAAGSLSADQIAISGAGGTDIAVVGTVDLDGTDGLVINLSSLGEASGNGLDMTMTNLALGTGTAIGDVEILGLNLDNTAITVRGH